LGACAGIKTLGGSVAKVAGALHREHTYWKKLNDLFSKVRYFAL